MPKVLKKRSCLLLENPEAGYPLGGELTGFRKLVVGATRRWEVIYRITDDKAVETVRSGRLGERADAEVYAEAKARVRAADGSRPDVVRLGEVIDRLGTLRADHASWVLDERNFTSTRRLRGSRFLTGSPIGEHKSAWPVRMWPT